MEHQGELFVDVNGLTLRCSVSGTGPLCIMPTPGWGPSLELYLHPLQPLEQLFTIAYLDTRGTGKSERPPEYTEYTFSQFSQDIDGLRRYLGREKVYIMGHSMGGVHALQYALAYAGRCAGLILLDSLPAFDQSQSADMQSRMEERRHEPWFGEAYTAFHDHSMPESDEEFGRWLMRSLPFYFYDVGNIEKHSPVFANSTFSLDAWKGSRQSWGTFNLVPELSKVTAPTLVVVGSHDFICSPLQAQRLHHGINCSKMVLIEKAGHFPWLEQPEQFFTLVQRGLAALGIP